MSSDWERLATFGSMVEADLVCARLEQAGIGALSATDDAGGAYPVMQSHGCRVLVRPADLERAQAVLAEAPELPDAVESEERLAAAEAEVATRGGGRRLVLGTPLESILVWIFVGFLLGFLASKGGLFTSDFVIDWTGDAYVLDRNADGEPDEWERYSGMYIASVEQDRNFDGEVDARWQYRRGRTSSGEHDQNFDGRVDTWENWTPTGLATVTWDTDDDGIPDGIDYYEHDVITRSVFTPGRGRPEREDLYEDGLLREIHLLDESGKRRLLVRFDELGRVVESRP